MGFQFSLATVLRVRGIVEEQEERMLQKILFELAHTREDLERTDSGISATNAARSEDLFKPLIGHHVHAAYGELEEFKRYKKELEEKIAKLEELRDRQLAIYAKARRNREMLTDMREEKRSAYESEMARAEQKTLDDNFIARRGRN